MKINVFSEISPLKNVIIHSPIGEHKFIKKINTLEHIDNKENPEFLLFDDIIDSNQLVKEHLQLQLVLNKFTNTKTLTFQKLLNEILDVRDIRINLIKKIIQSESSIYDNIISESSKKSKDPLGPGDKYFTYNVGSDEIESTAVR